MQEKKFRLALIVTVFMTGGAERMAQQLAAHLDREQVDLHVISVYPRQNHPIENSLEAAGIPLYFVDKRRGKDPAAMARMWKLLNRIRPDIIHTHMQSTFYALPWAAAHGVPQLQTIHISPEEEFTAAQRWIKNWARKAGFLRFGAISQKNQKMVAQYYGIDPDEVPWVNNPVETEKYYHVPRQEGEPFTYIHLGRLADQKNQSLAIRAMPRVLEAVPDARLLILGEGPLRQALEEEIRELGLEAAVCLYGLSPEPEHLLARAEVYVNPSHDEGLPLAVLEAEAAGLPVIATRVGGVADIVRDNGVLFEDNDLETLTREMIRFGTDPELRARCAEASRAIAREYDANLCARKYEQIYRDMLKKKDR